MNNEFQGYNMEQPLLELDANELTGLGVFYESYVFMWNEAFEKFESMPSDYPGASLRNLTEPPSFEDMVRNYLKEKQSGKLLTNKSVFKDLKL